jgi:hypothetical protein
MFKKAYKADSLIITIREVKRLEGDDLMASIMLKVVVLHGDM